jgi:hypothetical protein
MISIVAVQLPAPFGSTPRHRFKNPFTMSKRGQIPHASPPEGGKLLSSSQGILRKFALVLRVATLGEARKAEWPLFRPSHAIAWEFSPKSRAARFFNAKTGGAYRDRTDDPLLAKQVLSQLS